MEGVLATSSMSSTSPRMKITFFRVTSVPEDTQTCMCACVSVFAATMPGLMLSTTKRSHKCKTKQNKTKARSIMLVRGTIFIGNPGVGKSTLLNAAIGKPLFKSGLSIGTGLTTKSKMVEVDGEFWGDTPGLDDIKTREEAGKQIAKALRHGDGEYRLIFVVTQDSLRIRPADLTTITLVLDAIKIETNQEHTFGVIVNKMDPEAKDAVESSEEAWAAFTSMLQPKGYPAPKVLLYPRANDLVGAFDAVHDPPKYFHDFLEGVQPIYITSSKVEDIKYQDFDKLLMEYDELLEEKKKRQKLLKDIGYGAAALLGSVAVLTAAASGQATEADVERVAGKATTLRFVSAAAAAGGVTVFYLASKL